MKSYVKDFDRYNEVVKEIEIGRKFGVDYSSHKGKTKEVTDRYHPDAVDLIVSDIFEETADSKTIRLTPKDGYLPPFQAGQYINVFAEVNGIRTSRPYSISSSPRQRAYYDITVARVAGGFFSNYLLDSLVRGMKLKSTAPSGNFYFNPLFHSKKSVFIAGGSGVTPFMSMIREICDSGLDREIILLYGNRNEENIIFHDELLSLSSRNDNFTYIPVLSEAPEDYCGIKGFIDDKCIRENVAHIDDHTYYICGPGAMYEFCLPQIESLNIPAKKIRKEMFSSSDNITREAGWPAEISGEAEFEVAVQGRKTIKAKSGETLLTSLERAGIVVPVSCRSGECSLCRVKLVSGKVFQPRGVRLREADAKFGYVHSCKCYPLENLEIIL